MGLGAGCLQLLPYFDEYGNRLAGCVGLGAGCLRLLPYFFNCHLLVFPDFSFQILFSQTSFRLGLVYCEICTFFARFSNFQEIFQICNNFIFQIFNNFIFQISFAHRRNQSFAAKNPKWSAHETGRTDSTGHQARP